VTVFQVARAGVRTVSARGGPHRQVPSPGVAGEGRGGALPVQVRACRLGHRGPRLFRTGLWRPVTVVEAVVIVRSRLELKREFAGPAKGAGRCAFGGGELPFCGYEPAEHLGCFGSGEGGTDAVVGAVPEGQVCWGWPGNV